MNRNVTKRLSKDLTSLYEEGGVAKTFLDHAAGRQKAVAYTSVERAASVTGCSKPEIHELFRKLADIGAGEYKLGRRGSKTRIEWLYSISSVGLSAQGSEQEPIDIEAEFIVEDEEEEESDFIMHHFQLRRGYPITLNLPKDLTDREAERLATFVRSLPFE